MYRIKVVCKTDDGMILNREYFFDNEVKEKDAIKYIKWLCSAHIIAIIDKEPIAVIHQFDIDIMKDDKKKGGKKK